MKYLQRFLQLLNFFVLANSTSITWRRGKEECIELTATNETTRISYKVSYPDAMNVCWRIQPLYLSEPIKIHFVAGYIQKNLPHSTCFETLSIYESLKFAGDTLLKTWCGYESNFTVKTKNEGFVYYYGGFRHDNARKWIIEYFQTPGEEHRDKPESKVANMHRTSIVIVFLSIIGFGAFLFLFFLIFTYMRQSKKPKSKKSKK